MKHYLFNMDPLHIFTTSWVEVPASIYVYPSIRLSPSKSSHPRATFRPMPAMVGTIRRTSPVVATQAATQMNHKLKKQNKRKAFMNLLMSYILRYKSCF